MKMWNMKPAEIQYLEGLGRSVIKRHYKPFLDSGKITQEQYNELVSLGLIDNLEEFLDEFGRENVISVTDLTETLEAFAKIKELVDKAKDVTDKYVAVREIKYMARKVKEI